MILTVDLGTSVTKVVVWGDDGPVAIGRSVLDCSYGTGDTAEQDPASWWPSVVAACGEARAALGTGADAAFGAVGALGFAAARQTFVPVTTGGTPLGPALLWSDRRAGPEAAALARSFGEDGGRVVRSRTGVVLDAGSVAAKLAWLQSHEPHRLTAARWVLAPRDLVAWRLTGEVSTDHTLASATGLFQMSDGDGDSPDELGPLLPGLADAVADLLPASRPSNTTVGSLLHGPAAELGLPGGIPVVIGAGDRACEVLGTGASGAWPMVSWGTTANVSVPVAELVDPAPDALIATRGALGGWLLEGGLSAAGALIAWLAELAGLDTGALMRRAGASPPGSRGVIVLPWFGGARAPWWRDTARGAVVGLSLHHDVGDMARAVVESVAWDVARCLESAAASQGPDATTPVGLVLGGTGANVALWTEILSAVTGLPARRRRSGEAASAGAAVLVTQAIGNGGGGGGGSGGGSRGGGSRPGLDRLDPVDAEISPDPSMVSCYAMLRPGAEAAATAVIALGGQRETVGENG